MNAILFIGLTRVVRRRLWELLQDVCCRRCRKKQWTMLHETAGGGGGGESNIRQSDTSQENSSLVESNSSEGLQRSHSSSYNYGTYYTTSTDD